MLCFTQGLHEPKFQMYLAQPSSLRELFLCLYDERLEVREKAVQLAGSLCSRNPAQSLPALRKFLMRLMIGLRCERDALQAQHGHAARLLSLLIKEAPRLVQPFVRPILSQLTSRLRESRQAAEIDAATPLLRAISDFAASGRTNLTEYLPELLPIIVASLQVREGPQCNAAGTECALAGRFVRSFSGRLYPCGNSLAGHVHARYHLGSALSVTAFPLSHL